VTVSWAALFICLSAELGSVTQIVAFVVTSLMLYRSSVFTHELAHMAPTRFVAFRYVWNVFYGCPFLMPTFLYTDHRVHHTNQTYGTPEDAEYFPYVHRPFKLLIGSQLLVAIMPLLPVLRFGILTPISLLHPRIRKLVWERASSLGSLSPSYRREPADKSEWWACLWQESACFLIVVAFFTAAFVGRISWTSVALIYGIYVLAMAVNNFRVYSAHRYVGTGEPMTFVEQMLDSTTIPTKAGILWGPLGMRFHALHHLFPAMPYHAMGQAHRRLMRQLPADSPYHQTLVRSMPASIANLIRTTWAESHPLSPAEK
jgi:fatty acid desaturase